MGGCRCSYRSCTARSDGVTHMFHFPVFDKVRCHQWLVNANRLEFLNLKLSQLKNRVVCQHHFKDEMFMNFKKEKLKFDAVPTENGPYCSTEILNTLKLEDVNNAYPISIEYIENDYLTMNDKKANFSVKYGDFLTNGELMDELNLMIGKDNDSLRLDNNNMKDLNRDMNTSNYQNSKLPNVAEPVLPHITSVSGIKYQNQNLNQESQNNVIVNKSENTSDKNVLSKNKSKIKIISEQAISEPVPLVGQFQYVSPSSFIILPNKSCIISDAPTHFDNKNDNSKKNAEPPKPCVKLEFQTNDTKVNTYTHTTKNESAPVKSVKHKITPEKFATIKEKRKLNMKIRNLVETCLENSDNIKEKENFTSSETKLKRLSTELCTTNHIPKVSSTHSPDDVTSKESELDKSNDVILFLTNRLKELENKLIHRIDDNSQRITDLQKSFTKDLKKKVNGTQTVFSEESHKKYLYQGISEYLSPDVNNLVYEELFINSKFSHPSCKKRRCMS